MKAIDPAYLEPLYRRDRARLEQWIHVYLEEAPKQLGQLSDRLACGAAAGLAAVAHDLRPQAHDVGSPRMLEHYGCTFDDVVAEYVYTTDMAEFLKQSAYRNTIYTKQFPAGSWIEVKGLALPEFMIEIELEVHKARH